MAATIRSLRNGASAVDNASRDDLLIGDVVTLTAITSATTYSWSLVFVPAGSTATFSGSAANVSPGDFTVDKVGPYLVRLITDIGLVTEDVEYVRLRALTTTLGLKLVAAGERRDATGTIPVDASPEGWTNDQNFNLLALETAVKGMVTVSIPFTFSESTPLTVCPVLPSAFIMHTRVFVLEAFDDTGTTIEVGVTGQPADLLADSDVDPTTSGTYISDATYAVSGPTNVILTIDPGTSSTGAGVVFVSIHNP